MTAEEFMIELEERLEYARVRFENAKSSLQVWQSEYGSALSEVECLKICIESEKRREVELERP